MSSSADVTAVLRIKDELSKSLQAANKSLKDLNISVKKQQGLLDKIGKNTGFIRLAATMFSAQAAMRLVSAGFRELGQFVSGSVGASKEFNDAFTKSTAIMGDLADTMKTEMVAAAVEVSKTTTFSATQAAEAYFFLASAGLNAAQSIGALPQVAAFAQAGSFDLARATDLLTDAQSALGYTSTDTAENMKQMARVSDVLVLANVKANASVEQFATALTQKGATALKTVNKSLEEGVAVLAVWANQGIKGEQAGTALNRVILDLTSKATKNAAAFKKNNIAVFDSTGTMRNMADIVQDLEKQLGGMSDAQKKATFQQLGFADKSSVYISSLLGQSEAIRDYQAAAEEATGFTDEVAAKQLESYASQVTLAEHAWENLQITLGDFITENEGILALIRETTDLMNRLTESLTENEKAWADSVGGGLDLFIGAIDAVVTAIGLLVTGLGKLVQGAAFLAKPFATMKSTTMALGDDLVAFGEGALAASAEIDILQEKIANAAAGMSTGALSGEDHAAAVRAVTESYANLNNTDTKIFKRLTEGGFSAGQAMEMLAAAAEKTAPAIDNLGGGAGALASVTLPSLEGAFDRLYDSMVPVKEEMIFLGSQGLAPAVGGFGDLEDAILNAEREFIPAKEGIGDVSAAMAAAVPVTVSWTEVTGNLTGIMGDAGNILSVFGVEVDSTIGKITRLISSFESLFSNITSLIGAFTGGGGGGGGLLGMLGGLFSGGGGEMAGIGASGLLAAGAPGTLGALGGAGGVAGAGGAAGAGGVSGAVSAGASSVIGGISTALAAIPVAGWIALAGIGTALLARAIFGEESAFDKAGRELGNAFGEGFSESVTQDVQWGIAHAIEASTGSDVQAVIQQNLGAIIGGAVAEGTANWDQLTERIADTFSFLERGQITATEAQTILNESVGWLIPELGELGAAGQAELTRLVNAAQAAGVEFEGLDQLISYVESGFTSLGIAIDTSLEGLASQFNLTKQQAKELADFLDVKVKTEIQKIAEELGIPPKLLREIGDALEKEFGIPVGDILALLETMGIDIGDLAEALGVDIPDSAKAAEESIGEVANETGRAADEADRLGREIGDIPRSVTVDINERHQGDGGIPGLQHGGWAPKAPTPFGQLYRLGEREPELVIPKSKLGQTAAAGGVFELRVTHEDKDGKVFKREVLKLVNDGISTGRIRI